tara:strand:+ start:180 stop:782 length:603 start_codon:yes stop_codon:yes gene_type:complete
MKSCPFTQIISLISFLFLFLFSACWNQPSFSNLADSSVEKRNKRDYSSIWSIEGVPLVGVQITYHGKSPKIPFDGPSPPYDWTKQKTDFYGIEITNLTDLPIRILKNQLDFEYGESSGPHGRDYIEQRYKTSLILPNDKIFRKNSWVWGKSKYNQLTKTFWAVIECNKDSLDPLLTALLEESSEKEYEFQFQLIQEFIRD